MTEKLHCTGEIRIKAQDILEALNRELVVPCKQIFNALVHLLLGS